jgi:hypothetical protein
MKLGFRTLLWPFLAAAMVAKEVRVPKRPTNSKRKRKDEEPVKHSLTVL